MSDDIVSTAEVETQDDVGIDPVCGKPVDIELAREGDLITEFAEREYVFCGPACRDRFLGRPIAFGVAGRSQP